MQKHRFQVIRTVVLLILAIALLSLLASCFGHRHSWSAWETEDGVTSRHCRRCGEIEFDGDVTPPHEHEFVNYVSDGNASCTADGTETALCTGCSETDTRTELGSKKEHVFLNYVSDENASCTADGTETALCTGCPETDTRTEVGSKKEHVFLNYVSDGNASCTADGTKTALCENCPETDTKTDVGSMTEHDTVTVTHEPSCTEKGSTVTSCRDCEYENIEYTDPTGHAWSAEEPSCTEDVYCESCREIRWQASGHSYTQTASAEASCTEGARVTYTCSACSDSYTDTVSQPKGHTVADWGDYEEEADPTAPCLRYRTYTAICSTCSETVEKVEGPFELHTLVASIAEGDEASCTEDGYKTYTCTVPGCGHSHKEAYSDCAAHAWVKDEGASTESVTVYGCACGESRRVINASGEDKNSATVDSDTLGEIGAVELEDATIELDASTTGALSGSVSITAEANRPSDIPGMTDELLQKIGHNNKVYSFGMTANGADVHEFSGTVTVRIPYELVAGDDPDCIDVWYIESDGTIKKYDAVYSNGYAVFETDHFSYYTVTRLSPEERCARYGCTWDERIYPVSCVSDGYTMHVCLRCGASYKDAVIPALGHSMTETTAHATCTTAGEILHACERCSYSYSVRIPATGHNYAVSDSREASCAQSGYTVYSCSSCGGSYRVSTPALAHTYTSVVTAPSCVRGGYTTNTCSGCGHSYISERTAPIGHSFVYEKKDASCTEDGYEREVCSLCQETVLLGVSPAGHTWDIDTPTCGRGQICTVCETLGKPATGRHAWDRLAPTCSEGQICTECGAEGAPATGRHTWDIDAPTCVRGQKCTACGADGKAPTGEHTPQNGVCTECGAGDCTHAYTESVTEPSCTAGGYTTYTCPLCGHSYTDNRTPAKGHSYDGNACTECGAERGEWAYYTELLTSLLASDGKTVRLENLEGLPLMNGRRVGFAELLIALDGERGLVGYGSCDVYDGATGELREGLGAALLDGTIYVLAKEGGVEQVYMKMDLDYALGERSDMLLQILSFTESELTPLLLELILHNGEALGGAISDVMTALFIKEELSGGTARYTLDQDAALALILLLSESTVGELLGESGRLMLSSLPYLTVGEMLDLASGVGITPERLLPTLDRLAAILSGGYAQTFEEYLSAMLEREIDLEALLSDERILGMTVGTLVSGMLNIAPEELPAMLGAYLESAYEMTVLELLSAVFAGAERVPSDEMTDETDQGIKKSMAEGDATSDSLRMLTEMLTSLVRAYRISFTVDASGRLINATLADALDAEGGFTLSLESGMHTELDYDALLDRIRGYVELPFLSGGEISVYRGEGYTVTVERDREGKVLSITVVGSEEKLAQNGYGDAPFGDYKPRYDQEYDKEYDKEQGKDPDKEQAERYYEAYYVTEMTVTYYLSDAAMIEVEPDCMGYLQVGYSVEIDYFERSLTRVYYYDKEGGALLDRCDYEGHSNGYEADSVLFFFYRASDGSTLIDVNYYGTMHDYRLDEDRSHIGDACGETISEVYVCTECGDEQIDEYKLSHLDVKETATLAPGAIDCTGGILYRTECTACGEILDEWTDFGHEPSLGLWLDAEIVEGLCKWHKLEYKGCLCGAYCDYYDLGMLDGMNVATSYFDASGATFDKPSANTVGVESTYSCPDCSLVITVAESTYKNGCQQTERRAVSVRFEGKLLLPEIRETSEEQVHSWKTEATLFPGASSCEEGALISSYCTECGAVGAKGQEIYWHETFDAILIDLAPYGIEGAVHHGICACGAQYNDAYLSVDGYVWCTEIGIGGRGHKVYMDEATGEYLALCLAETREGCTVLRTLSVLFGFSLDGSYSSESERVDLGRNESHVYLTYGELAPGAVSCQDGVSLYSACTYCGKRDPDSNPYTIDWHESVTQNVILLEDYGLRGALTVRGCACGAEGRWVDFVDAGWFSGEGSDGPDGGYMLYRFYGENGEVISQVLVKDEYLRDPMTCTARQVKTAYFGYDPESETSLASILLSETEVERHANELLTFVSLLPGSASCSDGIRVERRCPDCKSTVESYEDAWHCDGILRALDLTEYGAAEGTLYLRGCACGESTPWVTLSVNYMDEPFDEGGICGNDFILSADGFCIRIYDTYEVKDCMGRRYRTILIGYDPLSETATETLSLAYGYAEPAHNLREQVTLTDDGTSCEEGVLVTLSCRDCDYKDSYETNGHYAAELESYDFSDYGAGKSCGGKLCIYSCACGYTKYYTTQDILCELDSSNVQIGEYLASLYTCAVTDPACTFRYAVYNKHDFLENCIVKETYTILLGCDQNGENAKQTVTFTNTYKSHNGWTREENPTPTLVPCFYEYHVKEHCLVCGEIFSEYDYVNWGHDLDESGYCKNQGCDRCLVYTYDENGNVTHFYGINYEVYGDATISGGYELERYVDEVDYIVKGGYSLERSTYRKNEFVVGRDGWYSESHVTYTYHFDAVGECRRDYESRHYENGKLYEENSDSEQICGRWQIGREQTLTEPSCTQPGVVCFSNECALCGYAFDGHEYFREPLGHDWCYDENTQDFSCSRCKLHNQNGASGEVVLEELTSEDPDLIRIGYWNRSGGAFIVAVGAKLDSPLDSGEDEIYLGGFEVAIGETVITLSRSAAEAAILSQYGLSPDAYDLRITLVGEGLSDYGITLN